VARRILLLVTDLKIGGTPTVVRELASRLHHPPAVSVHVMCLDRGGPVGEQIRARGIPVTALDAIGIGDFLVVKRLLRRIRAFEIDTVVSFLIHANAVAAAASLFCSGVRFFQSIQTTQPRPRWHWMVQRFVQRAAESIIVPSEAVASAARQKAKIPANKICVIPNAIDPGDYPPVLPQERVCDPPHRVVFLGRLDPIKRIGDLLEAVAQLGTLVKLDIYGEGEQRSVLIQQMRKLNINDVVHLRGPISDPRQALKDAELLVLPSEAEGFGLVLIEAMAAGVPVVATDAPGINEVVKSGVTGKLVPVGAPDKLAAAMKLVLTDENLRRKMIPAAWQDVRKRFTWDMAMDRYRELLGITIGG
jgi:glycosyltransferase involved in cell wall biosynthesis